MLRLAFARPSRPPTWSRKGGVREAPKRSLIVFPWRLIIAVVSAVLVAAREQMLPSPPRSHFYPSVDAGFITVTAPIGPLRSPAHVFSSFYGEVAQFPLAFLDDALPLCAFLFLQNHFLDDFNNVNVLAQFCEPSEVMAIYTDRELLVRKLIE